MSKHIIIGAGGIGSAIARRLRQQGAELHLISRKPQALAAELGATHAVADVSDATALEAAVKAAGSQIDGLCYSVGTINLKPVGRLTDQDALRDFEINALGAFRAIKAALPALKASGQATSSVLLFSTVAVAQGFASHASVAMAKGAIEGLTKSLAAELAPKIRVNCIAPSLTRTPLASFITSNEPTTTAIAGMHALQRIGEGEDIAALGGLLLSPDAGWITGQIIGVDGGRSSLRTKG
jgi:NAD(P)-dependent dehydrogenase (short-subunit alcohol dehydrogenase family)